MRILALLLLGCGAAAPPPPVISASAPIDAAPVSEAESSPPDAPAIEDVSVVAPSSTPGRTPRIPTSSLAPTQSDQNKAAIRAMIKRQRDAISACYMKWSPDALPRVVIRITIGPDGRVLSSQASGAQAGLENCIVELYRGDVLDPPPGGTITVTYPLNFDTAGS